jgi:undecaprenyl pyrophosphate synthase
MLNTFFDREEILKQFPILSNITELSIYVLSKDNLTRQDNTISFIEDLFTFLVNHLYMYQSFCRIDFIGNLELLPETLQLKLTKISSECDGPFPFHIAIGYDPIQDSKSFLENQGSRTQMDLVIRSGYQIRSSGFFPLQTLYSEWIYYDVLWPDMKIHHIIEALEEFFKRKRNFGK